MDWDCVLVVCCPQAESRGERCHRRGVGDTGWAGLYASNERWQETIPTPNLFLYKPMQPFKLLPLPIILKSATFRSLKERNPAPHRALLHRNSWHKNRTDVLFKSQSKHFINHLHTFPHHSYKKGSCRYLAFFWTRRPKHQHFTPALQGFTGHPSESRSLNQSHNGMTWFQ